MSPQYNFRAQHSALYRPHCSLGPQRLHERPAVKLPAQHWRAAVDGTARVGEVYARQILFVRQHPDALGGQFGLV